MNNISNNKCYISTTLGLDDLRVRVINKTQELFMAVGIDMPAEEIRIEESGDNVYLYLKCFDNLVTQTEHEKELTRIASDIGFSDMGCENMEFVCEHIFQTPLSFTLDPQASDVLFAFYMESYEIMSKINKLYNDIDNMTAKEAKQSVAELYAHLKNEYGWSES